MKRRSLTLGSLQRLEENVTGGWNRVEEYGAGIIRVRVGNNSKYSTFLIQRTNGRMSSRDRAVILRHDCMTGTLSVDR